MIGEFGIAPAALVGGESLSQSVNLRVGEIVRHAGVVQMTMGIDEPGRSARSPSPSPVTGRRGDVPPAATETMRLRHNNGAVLDRRVRRGNDNGGAENGREVRGYPEM